MDPVTHALSSWALARAGFQRASRWATPALIVSGIAADLDLAIFWKSPLNLLRFGGALLHSLLGSVFLVALIATSFWALGKGRIGGGGKPSLKFGGLLLVCAVGQADHLLLDVCGSECVRLLWPFRDKCFRLDWVTMVDLWILLILLAAVLLPSLFAMVSEEIGERSKRPGHSRGAVVALVIICLFLGVRAILHTRASALLRSRVYAGESPQVTGAFPLQAWPLEWRVVAATTGSVYVGPVLLTAPEPADTEHYQALRKPDPSPWLDAAQHSPVAAEFLKRARFPFATWEPLPNGGYLVQVRDLRYPPSGLRWFQWMVQIRLDAQSRVLGEDLCAPAACPRR